MGKGWRELGREVGRKVGDSGRGGGVKVVG